MIDFVVLSVDKFLREKMFSSQEEVWMFEHEDHICLICGKWSNNYDDLDDNFRCCESCPQSYHKQCIPPYFAASEDEHRCNRVFRNETSKYQCCNRTQPKLRLEISSDDTLRGALNYIYIDKDKEIYWNSKDKRREREIINKYRTPKYVVFMDICNA